MPSTRSSTMTLPYSAAPLSTNLRAWVSCLFTCRSFTINSNRKLEVRLYWSFPLNLAKKTWNEIQQNKKIHYNCYWVNFQVYCLESMCSTSTFFVILKTFPFCFFQQISYPISFALLCWSQHRFKCIYLHKASPAAPTSFGWCFSIKFSGKGAFRCCPSFRHWLQEIFHHTVTWAQLYSAHCHCYANRIAFRPHNRTDQRCDLTKK